MIHGNGGHIRAFALAWTICGKHSLFSRFVCGLSDDTAASPDAVCRMVAVPGGCRTLSHLYFQREAQRLRCGGPGMGNGKRNAEIHHEVICVACRNGDVSAKLCMKSLDEVFPCFMKIFG